MKLFDSIKRHLNLMKMKRMAKQVKREVVGKEKLKLSPQGEKFTEYLIKVLGNDDYTADGYGEYMFEEKLKEFCSENSCSMKNAAYAYLLMIYAVI